MPLIFIFKISPTDSRHQTPEADVEEHHGTYQNRSKRGGGMRRDLPRRDSRRDDRRRTTDEEETVLDNQEMSSSADRGRQSWRELQIFLYWRCIQHFNALLNLLHWYLCFSVTFQGMSNCFVYFWKFLVIGVICWHLKLLCSYQVNSKISKDRKLYRTIKIKLTTYANYFWDLWDLLGTLRIQWHY